MRVLRWLIFTVIFALVPLGFHAIQILTKGPPPKIPVFVEVLASGELLLISTAIAADATGDLIASGRTNQGAKFLSAGGCMLALIFSAYWYGLMKMSDYQGKLTDPATVAWTSEALFGLTVVAAACCKKLSK